MFSLWIVRQEENVAMKIMAKGSFLYVDGMQVECKIATYKLVIHFVLQLGITFWYVKN